MDGSTSGPLLSWGNLRTRVVQAGGWVLAGFVLDKLIATAQLMVSHACCCCPISV
jgi:hypothetical protein